MACNCGFRKRLRTEGLTARPERTVYLDACATTAPDPRVLGALDRACRTYWGNPSSPHVCGNRADDLIQEARTSLGTSFSCDSEGIHFCSSGSEALHAALWGFAIRYPGAALISTGIEHAALKAPLRMLKAMGRTMLRCPVDEDGVMDLDQLKKLMADHPGALVAYSAVNHETGTVQPVRSIAELARAAGCFVLLDAVQGAARLPAQDWATYADAFALSAHKIHGLKGSALLWKRPDWRLSRTRFGGTQEHGFFPGTENVPGIAAMAAAAGLLAKERGQDRTLMIALERDFFDLAQKRGLALVRESPADHAPGIFCISLPWAASMEELLMELNRRQICISRFSACSARVDGPSTVLAAMGRPTERSSRSLRIGLGRWNKREDLYALIQGLEAMVPTSIIPNTVII